MEKQIRQKMQKTSKQYSKVEGKNNTEELL